jgi:hypothetical protein
MLAGLASDLDLRGLVVLVVCAGLVQLASRLRSVSLSAELADPDDEDE